MPDLTDCYFCGSIEAPLDTYPLIPPETEPPPGLQETVVLCPTCRTKLDRVMDPLFEHLASDVSIEDDGSTQSRDASRSADETNSAQSSASEDEGRVDIPDEARDVVRLLRNREFPVERDEIATVAANAYELSLEEANDALDALIAHDRLREDNGELRRK